ncbi:MAG: glycogen/starch synthase [Bacteroidaceae bacterium]|nr:glycogen/starch synthase [Bacteroidaceae bacterium]
MEAKKVLFITTEIEPFVPENEQSRKGRILPQSIQELGHEIRTFSPKWGIINERRNQLHEVIRLSGMNLIIDETDHPLIIKVASLASAKMQVYFIDNDDYFMKRGLLTDKEGKEYADNGERAIFYARGVLETVKKLGWRPDVIHCYGWAAALAPFYIKQAYSDEPSFRDAKVVMEVSPKEFSRDLGKKNARYVEYKDAHYADIQDICSQGYGHTELEKIGVKFSDGVIIEHEDVDPSIIEYAKSLGLPILGPVEGEFNKAYSAFYDQIFGDEPGDKEEKES